MEEDVGNIPIDNDPIRSPGHDVCGNGFNFEESTNNSVNTNVRNCSQAPDMRLLGIQPYSGPENPDMGPLEARKSSFHYNGWDDSVPVSVEKLAEAGFYYIGIYFL